LGYVGELLKKHLKSSDMALIAHIALLPANHEAILELLRSGQAADEALADPFLSPRLENGVVIWSDDKSAHPTQVA
jgi:hypothetical protein